MNTHVFDSYDSDDLLDDDSDDFTETHLDSVDLGEFAFAYASRGDLSLMSLA